MATWRREPEVLGLVDGAHSAFAEDALDDVAVADGLADEVGLEVPGRAGACPSRDAAAPRCAPPHARRCGASRGRTRAARVAARGAAARSCASEHSRSPPRGRCADQSSGRPAPPRRAASCSGGTGRNDGSWNASAEKTAPEREYRHRPGASNAPGTLSPRSGHGLSWAWEVRRGPRVSSATPVPVPDIGSRPSRWAHGLPNGLVSWGFGGQDVRSPTWRARCTSAQLLDGQDRR